MLAKKILFLATGELQLVHINIYIKINGGGHQTRGQGRGKANQHEQWRGKHPHFSRRGTIQITMKHHSHPHRPRWHEEGGMKSAGRGSRRKTAIRFLTWKDMAERRNEVMDMVAQVVSWAKAGGTNRFVRLPMSLIRPILYTK